VIVATLGDYEVAWDHGTVTVQPDPLVQIMTEGPIARAGLAADCLRLQADVDRRMNAPAYDPAAFDQDDRPFRVRPGSAAHARLVFAALDAVIALDFEEDDAEIDAIVAELAAGLDR